MVAAQEGRGFELHASNSKFICCCRCSVSGWTPVLQRRSAQASSDAVSARSIQCHVHSKRRAAAAQPGSLHPGDGATPRTSALGSAVRQGARVADARGRDRPRAFLATVRAEASLEEPPQLQGALQVLRLPVQERMPSQLHPRLVPGAPPRAPRPIGAQPRARASQGDGRGQAVHAQVVCVGHYYWAHDASRWDLPQAQLQLRALSVRLRRACALLDRILQLVYNKRAVDTNSEHLVPSHRH